MKRTILLQATYGVKKRLFFNLLCSIVNAYLVMQIPMFFRYIIDGILLENKEIIPCFLNNILQIDKTYSLGIMALLMIAIYFLITITKYIRENLNNKIELSVNRNLKTFLFKHIQSLEYEAYQSYDKAEMIQRIDEDANVVSNFFRSQLNLMIDTFFLMLFILAESIQLNKLITIYLGVSILIMILFSIWYLKKLNVVIEERITKKKRLINTMLQTLERAKVIRLFNKQEEEIEEFTKLNQDYKVTDIQFIKLILFHEISSDYLIEIATPILYLVGGIFAIQGKLGIGTLIALISFCSNLLEHFELIANQIDGIEYFFITQKRLKKLMQLKKEKVKQTNFALNGNITFRNASIFINKQCILKDLNFEIQQGEKMAWIGENGTGKSILSKVLLGLYSYTGSILINGVELREIGNANKRQYISLVLEEPFLFSGTVLENIAGKDEKKDLKKIAKSCKDAEILEDIRKMPLQLESRIGEKGIKLSGGQKQRLALARMLYEEKPIQILDDTFSKVDIVTKNRLVQHIMKASNTVIMITQDLSMITQVDSILFFYEHTAIKESKKQLYQNNDYYREFIKKELDKVEV